jgi:hypothetical protein
MNNSHITNETMLRVTKKLLERFGEPIGDANTTIGVADERNEIDEELFEVKKKKRKNAQKKIAKGFIKGTKKLKNKATCGWPTMESFMPPTRNNDVDYAAMTKLPPNPRIPIEPTEEEIADAEARLSLTQLVHKHTVRPRGILGRRKALSKQNPTKSSEEKFASDNDLPDLTQPKDKRTERPNKDPLWHRPKNQN